VTGGAGHSALASRFVSALHLAVDYVNALRGVQTEYQTGGAQDPAYDIPCTTLHVGRLNSGTALNIVPDRADMLFEFRHLVADDPDALEARLYRQARDVAAAYGDAAQITLYPLAHYPGLAVAPSDPMVTHALRWTGGAPCHVAFGTEAGVLTKLGVPTLVCGPGSMEGQGHKPDEFITEAQLHACAQMLDTALRDLVLAP